MSDRGRQRSDSTYLSSRQPDRAASRLVRRARGETIVFPKEAPAGPPEEPQKKRRVWLLVVLAVVVVLILGGVAASMLGVFGRGGAGGGASPQPTAGSGSPGPAAGSFTFRFLPAQEREERLWGGFRTLVGDVNGDRRADLIWNEPAETNRVYVGLGQADGTLRFLPAQDRAEKRWSGFQTFVGDVNGDGRADLIWNEPAETNRVYVGLGQNDGTLQFLPAQDHPEKEWAGFHVLVGDFNGDGRADLVWNRTQDNNRLYLALGQADGTFQFLPPQERTEQGWSGFQALVGDVNGDGRADLIWNETAEHNRIYVGLGQGDGTFQFLPGLDHPEKGWTGFQALAGDVNGDGRADLIWNAISETNRVYVGLGQGDGTFQFLPAQDHPDRGWAGFRVLGGDFNGDGRADLAWNAITDTNRLYLGLGQPQGTFQFLPAQEHPEKGWEGFRVLAGDVNGDGWTDLVWNATQETNRVFVGLSGK
jgi:hypothetical protein